MICVQKRKWHRFTAWLLCFCMILSLSDTIVYASGDMDNTSLCVHHPVHTEGCGYLEGEEEVPCDHIHDENCGYQEEIAEVPCAHEHDKSCGYQKGTEEVPCTHQHDKDCGWEEGEKDSCTHSHDEDCDYQAAAEELPCTHKHDKSCGYQAKKEESPCVHEHDKECGYQAATEGSSCTFFCPICYSDYYPDMKDSGVSIIVSDDDKANTFIAGEQTDLLKDVHLNIDEGKENELTVDDFSIAVFSIIDDETQESVELTDGRYLTAEVGCSYRIVYAAYNNKSGDLTAAAERTVSAVELMTLEGNILEESTQYIAYDNGTTDGEANEEDDIKAANTKFTVTLPIGTEFYQTDGNAVDDFTALILKVKQFTALWEGFTIHKDLIDQHMNWHTGVTDSTNDAQFWRIWFEDENGNEVNVKLPGEDKAKVVVEYLCPDGDTSGALKGELGTRRTCVMDMGDPNIGVPVGFTDTDDYALEASNEPEDLIKEDNHYTKITYYIDANKEGNSAWGNLVALCAMKLTAGYMQSAIIEKIADGSSPWDAEEKEGKEDQPGNDSSDNNRIVRSFDSVVYTLKFVSASRSARGQLDEYIAVTEADLDLDIAQARFDTTSLSNIFIGDEDWQIQYRDKSGKNLYIENKSGIFQCDSDGNITSTKVNLNNIINGSDNKDAYRTNVTTQHLVAYRKITAQAGETAVPSTQTSTIQINVRAAQNGTKIEPKFVVYVKGNKDNFTSEQDSNNQYVVSAPSNANEIITKDTDHSIKVSAAAHYNIVIKRNADAGYRGYFNFETGQEDADGIYGRMLSYGITLQLFNETNDIKADGSVNGATLAEKGMRGIELPVDEITFNLTVKGDVGNSSSTDDYSAILWDYAKNKEGQKEGLWGRNMYWQDSNATTFPKGASIYSEGDRRNSAYGNGDWSLTASGDGVLDGKTTDKITNTGKDVTYTFTVKGFDFDFEDFTFASQSAGNAGDVAWLAPNYIGSFSGGHIQVLQKFPADPSKDASPELTVEVGNIHIKSQSGKEITTEAKEVTNEIGGTKDNIVRYNVPVYTPGGISQHNSFGDRKNGHGSISLGFLGSDYWNSPNYDADTFSGNSIYLWGGAQLSRNSDAVVSAYNLLQKFDSKVLSIDTSVNVPVRYTEVNADRAWPAEGWPDNKEGQLLPAAGDYKILYAADPLYPGGWDSNNSEQMKRMNEAKEKDLIYFNSLKELEEADYTCIAVLLEVRNANIPAGCYPGVRIAVKVSDKNEYINKTICTVNTARMWVKRADRTLNLLSNISWENGDQNNLSRSEAEKLDSFENTITDKDGKDIYSDYWNESNKDAVNRKIREEYDDSTVTYLIGGYNNNNYHKTEYKDGTKVEGTHEGYQQGMSLLVIGYESTVGIKVENTQTNKASTDTDLSGNVSFETSKGQWNPLYTITDIKTTPSDPQGTTSTDKTTDLIIKASVQNQKGKDQIAMGMADFKVLIYELDEKGNPEKDENDKLKVKETFIVSEAEDNPTNVTFTGTDGKTYTYKIWAERTDEYETVFYLSGVPIGMGLPDIQFEGQLGADVQHNGNYKAQVTIQGDSDHRALSSGNRNIANVSVTTVSLEGTSLTKKVDTNLIEKNGTITYSVSYTNNADEAMKQKLFLYDLMPYNGDIRSSDYERNSDMTQVSDALAVTKISADISSKEGDTSGNDETVARVYYSTIPGAVIREYVDFAKGTDTTGTDIGNLLRDALLGNDANGVWYVVKKGDETHTSVPIYTYDPKAPEIVTGINTTAVDYESGEIYGGVIVKDGYEFYNPRLGITAGNGEEVPNNTSTAEKDSKIKLECYKMFRWLGSIQPGKDGSNSLVAGESNLSKATCVYVVAEKLGGGKTLNVSMSLQTKGNEAANHYGNIAHSWKAGDTRDGANLVSNMVSTRVIGREISGLVWEDINFDGIRNQVKVENEKGEEEYKDEPLISGVTCTLFKLNESTNQYEPCSEGVNGRPVVESSKSQDGTMTVGDNMIPSMVTGKDGAYSFKNLASGKYVVAFSGEVLKEYKGGATRYQVNKTNDSDTNDGVPNSGFPGVEGDYCIQYSVGQASVYMHTLDEIKNDTGLLDNSVESVDHQDLGVIKEHYKLPDTGGSGTMPYRTAGILLIAACLPGTILLRKRKRDVAK